MSEYLIFDLDMKSACTSDSGIPALASALWKAASRAECISQMSRADMRYETLMSFLSRAANTSFDRMNALLDESTRLLTEVAEEVKLMGNESVRLFMPTFLIAALHLSNAREDVKASSGRFPYGTMSTRMLTASNELIQATNAVLDADRLFTKAQK